MAAITWFTVINYKSALMANGQSLPQYEPPLHWCAPGDVVAAWLHNPQVLSLKAAQ
jgi:hypothetical protein